MKQRAEEEAQRAVAAQEVFKFKESELQKKDEDLEVIQAFFCAFSKKLKAIWKKLKAHFEQKTQPIGG